MHSGPIGGDVYETAVAVTRWHRLAGCISTSPLRLRASWAANQSSTWTPIDPWSGPTEFIADDPSIAPLSGSASSSSFVLFGRTLTSLKYSVFDTATGFGPVEMAVSDNYGTDKPWVVRRAQSDWLVFWWDQDDGVYKYLRSSTGAHWGEAATPSATPISVEADSPIPAFFCCQPCVGPDGDIYLAYATGNFDSGGKIRVLVGTEVFGSLVWNHLRTSNGEIVELLVRHGQGTPLPVPCTPGVNFFSKTVPQIAADPVVSGRIYIAYHDHAADDADDMNIYLQKLTKSGSAWNALVVPVRVNDDAELPGAVRNDQFAPAIAVDSQSRVHVTFYDNREGVCNAGTPSRFDFYHAISGDAGASFTNRNLRQDCEQERAMDTALHGVGYGATWSPREYNGIGLYNSGSTTRVWVTYSGTSSVDPDSANTTVIYGQLIVVTE